VIKNDEIRAFLKKIREDEGKKIRLRMRTFFQQTRAECNFQILGHVFVFSITHRPMLSHSCLILYDLPISN